MKKETKEIKEALEAAVGKVLPKIGGELLTKRLEEADALEERNGALHKKNEDQVDIIVELKKDIKVYKADAERVAKLESDNINKLTELVKREENLRQKELHYELVTVKHELACIKGSKEEIKELMALAFKNPVIKKSVLSNKPITPGNYESYQDAQGMWQSRWVQNGPEGGLETTDTTEITE